MKDNKLYKYKFLLLGLIVTALACFWLYTVIGHAWDELILMRHHETCSGFLVDAWEKTDTDGYLHCSVTYTYSIPDGRQFTQTTLGDDAEKYQSWDLPYPIEVEYIPDNPTVSRIKGDGPHSIPSWLWHEVVGHGAFILLILIAILLAIGIYLLYHEVKELKKLRKAEKSMVYPDTQNPDTQNPDYQIPLGL